MRRCAPRPLFCASSVTCWSLVNWTCKGSVWTNQAPVLCFFKEREPVVPWRSWWPLRALGAFIDDDSLLMVLAGQPRGVDELSFRGCISFNGDCHAPCVQRIRLLSIPLPCAVMHKRSRPICAARRGPPAQLGNFLRRGYFSFFFRHVGRSFFFFLLFPKRCSPPSLSVSLLQRAYALPCVFYTTGYVSPETRMASALFKNVFSSSVKTSNSFATRNYATGVVRALFSLSRDPTRPTSFPGGLVQHLKRLWLHQPR